MDQTAYKRWWPLHLRVVRGETLTADESAVYEAGLRQLEQEEAGSISFDAPCEARAPLASLEAEQACLRQRRQEVEAEIAVLHGMTDRGPGA